jgi:DNA polymerase-3 subunit delta
MSSNDLADLKPVYLIFGPEELLLDQAVERLRRRLSAVADLDFNLDAFDGETATADAIVGAANTLPFMSERRLVIVRKADRMSTADLNVLAEYATNPNPETTLVLVATKIAKNLRIYKAIDKTGQVSEYKAPSKRDYPRTVVEMFAARDRRIGLEAAEVLVRAVGHDLRRLSIEIDKVIAFTGDRQTLSRDDVEEVMSTTAPTSIFDFLDALGSRECRDALRLLASLVAEGESIHGIHAMSLRHVRNLLGVRALRDRGDQPAGAAAIAAQMGMMEWQARNLIRQADRFAAGELVDALRMAAAGEAEMKTSREPRLVFERWIVSVCG